MMGNELNHLGCEFLGKMLSKNENLKTLTLDHNNIGSEGLA